MMSPKTDLSGHKVKSHKPKRIGLARWAAVFVAVFGSGTTVARGDPTAAIDSAEGASSEGLLSAALELYQTSRTQPGPKVSDRRDQQAQFDRALQDFSAQAFVEFSKGSRLPRLEAAGRPSRAYPDWMLQEFRVRLESSVTQEFFRKTLEGLGANGSPSSQRFVRDTQQRFGDFYLAGFRIFSEFAGQRSEQGRFSPGTGEIWIALQNLSFADWHVVFVHELAHALDPALAEADRSVSRNPDWWSLFWSTKSQDSLDALAPSEREQILAFARALLNRGLLSEVRAWRATLSVLAEVAATDPAGFKQLTLPQPFSEVATWLQLSLSETELELAVFRSLKPRFRLPQPGAQLDSLVMNQALTKVLDATEDCLADAARRQEPSSSC